MTTFTEPAAVVAWFGAVQAQDYLGALWAVGLRLLDAHERDVERALSERTIVRSWPMRGTLHFLAAADARWMIELLAPRVATAAAKRLRALGIDESVLSRARRALVKELEGNRQLTRSAVYGALGRARVSTQGERGLHVLWRLAHEGLICFGAREGKQQTFALLEEWLPRAKRRARDEALVELARRYFTAHGPATLRDFAWWTGMTLAEARLATEMAGKSIEREVIGDETYHFADAALPARSGRAPKPAYALPAFDEFFVGCADRRAAVDPAHAQRVSAFELLTSVALVDGRFVGTWKRRIVGERVILATRLLAPLAPANAAGLRRALERYASYLELSPAFETAPSGGKAPAKTGEGSQLG